MKTEYKKIRKILVTKFIRTDLDEPGCKQTCKISSFFEVNEVFKTLFKLTDSEKFRLSAHELSKVLKGQEIRFKGSDYEAFESEITYIFKKIEVVVGEEGEMFFNKEDISGTTLVKPRFLLESYSAYALDKFAEDF